jgi:hypothetical protein
MPYEPGDAIEQVFDFHTNVEVAGEVLALQVIADRAYDAFNGYAPMTWERHQDAYYALGNRSLSVGDVIVFGEVALAVERVGWRIVAIPSEVTA